MRYIHGIIPLLQRICEEAVEGVVASRRATEAMRLVRKKFFPEI